MNIKTKTILALVLVAIGVAGRLLPHAWNFAPIVAIGLFAGAYLGKRFAFVVPVAVMVISDLFIGFYSWKINLTVYVAMALAGGIGLLLRKKDDAGKYSVRARPMPIATAGVAGSTLFFLLTNGAVWYFGSSYDPGINGLFASYIAGLPFFRNAIIGDVWYSLALFGTYALVTKFVESWSKRKSLVKI